MWSALYLHFLRCGFFYFLHTKVTRVSSFISNSCVAWKSLSQRDGAHMGISDHSPFPSSGCKTGVPQVLQETNWNESCFRALSTYSSIFFSSQGIQITLDSFVFADLVDSSLLLRFEFPSTPSVRLSSLRCCSCKTLSIKLSSINTWWRKSESFSEL